MDLKTPFYTVDKWYSVTLNPDNDHQYVGKIDRLGSFRNFINENVVLALNARKIKYVFCVEISETKEGNSKNLGPRLHLHGRIIFNKNAQIKEFLLTIIPQWLKFSQIDIDTIDNLWYWDNYCYKQQHIMQTPKFTNSEMTNKSFMYNVTNPDPLASNALPGIVGAAEPLAPKRSETGAEDPLEAHVESEAPQPPLFYYFPPSDDTPLLVIDSVTGLPVNVQPIPTN